MRVVLLGLGVVGGTSRVRINMFLVGFMGGGFTCYRNPNKERHMPWLTKMNKTKKAGGQNTDRFAT